MAVKFQVEDLHLCAWVDPMGRTRRATFSAEQLELVYTEALVWLKVFLRLSERWPVVAAC